MKCNMFSKDCDLLTCSTKKKCLWTKLESDTIKESARNFNPLQFPPQKPNHIK